MNQEVETFLQYYNNYQQDDWTEWLGAAEFQYNNKKHMTTEWTLFKLNFGRYLWKGNLVIQIEFLKLEEFLTELQQSREKATKSIEEAQKNMKRQFNKKRRNLQGLKVRDNVWLENKNTHLNQPLKKLDQKRYRSFRISKDISLGVFQLELLEGWMIYNVFNKDLLTKCKALQFKEQHMDPAPSLIIINEEEEYEVEEVWKHRKQGRGTQYLVHWKSYMLWDI